ncbi:hypothetical protein [Laspinema olomoucense]|uniref:Uncharacterized protein n=1 Tax=Laspinema olomoucense D3b TaxID=2953688 RepID=A0ABT2NEE9_9CYAN|nr:hypothetical protein [Laspinema sp. D3b]MCT7981083.1 hypothetical protein [Laspinema sp. D3b]
MTNPKLNVEPTHAVGLPHPLKSTALQEISPPRILSTDEQFKESEVEEVEYLDQLLTEEWDYYHLGYFDLERF